MWYHLTDMIHGRGQRKRVEYVGETRKKQGIPAVIYDTTDTDALRRIYSMNVLVWRRRRVNAGRKRER